MKEQIATKLTVLSKIISEQRVTVPVTKGDDLTVYAVYEKKPTPEGILHPFYNWKLIQADSQIITCYLDTTSLVNAVDDMGLSISEFSENLDNTLQSWIAILDVRAAYVDRLDGDWVTSIRIKNDNFAKELKKAATQGTVDKMLADVLSSGKLESKPSLSAVPEEEEDVQTD